MSVLEIQFAGWKDRSEEARIDLTGEKDARNRIVKAVSHSGQQIHPPGPLVAIATRGPTFDLGIPFCREKPPACSCITATYSVAARAGERVDQVAIGGAIDHKHLVDAPFRQRIDDEVRNLDHETPSLLFLGSRCDCDIMMTAPHATLHISLTWTTCAPQGLVQHTQVTRVAENLKNRDLGRPRPPWPQGIQRARGGCRGTSRIADPARPSPIIRQGPLFRFASA